MIILQHVIRAVAMMLALLLMQGCSSMELAIDLYKKQKRDAAEKSVLAAPRYKVETPIK